MSDFTSAERSTEEHTKAVFGYITEGETERKGIYCSGVAYQLPFHCLNVIMMKLTKNIFLRSIQTGREEKQGIK